MTGRTRKRLRRLSTHAVDFWAWRRCGSEPVPHKTGQQFNPEAVRPQCRLCAAMRAASEDFERAALVGGEGMPAV
jgi:hypothetical protein